MEEKFYCDKCNGITHGVNYCDNPNCPNMPCCGKPRDACACYSNEKLKENETND